MPLTGFREEKLWSPSSFNLTSCVRWDKILAGVRGAFPCFKDPEDLVDDATICFSSPDEILSIPEAGSITVRVI